MRQIVNYILALAFAVRVEVVNYGLVEFNEALVLRLLALALAFS